MTKYIKAAQISFLSRFEYRVDFLFGLLSRFFPALIQFYMWTAIFQSSPDTVILGYTYPQMIAYTLLSIFLSGMISVKIQYKIAEEIKAGELSRYLVLPVRYVTYKAAEFIGGKVSEIIFLVTGVAVLLGILQKIGFFAAEPGAVLAAALLLFLAMALQFLLCFCLACTAFWMGECGGIFTVVEVAARIISGGVFPLDIFGKKAVLLSKCFPFYYTTYFLTNTLLGKNDVSEIAGGVCSMLAWITVLGAVGCFLWKRGQKKYISAGG